MKKGIFSLMMGLLLAFTGLVRANELTVHDGTTQNSNVPAYVSYFDDFTRAQSVYPAAELAAMNGGTIESIKLYCTSSNIPYTTVSTANVYLTEVDYTSISAYVPTANCTMVYSGTLSFVSAGNGGECTITFSTPYTYNGGNLLLGVENVNDLGYKFIYFLGETVDGASISGYNGSSLANVTANQRNFLPKTTFTYSAGGQGGQTCPLTVAPDPADFGYRPNECWMRPMVVTLTNEGAATSIYGIDVNNSYFVPESMEIPFALDRNESVDINFGWTTGEGEINGRLVVDYQSRTVALFDIMATAYTPVCPDVFEMARVVNSFPYTETLNAGRVPLYDNYLLPPTSVEDGPDAVWKLTFTEDQLLNASVDGENGKIAVYTEDFYESVYGFAGPDIQNNYTGPQIGNGGGGAASLTLYEGATATQYYSPVFTLYGDELGAASQCIYPAAELAAMNGGTINSMTFYLSSVSNASNLTATWKGYIMEVPYTTTTEFAYTQGQVIWEGPVSVIDNQMIINFSTPYTYNGGNLLIGFENIQSAAYTTCNFYSEPVTNGIIYRYRTTGDTYTSSYLPKVTFDYAGRNANRDVTASIENLTMLPGTYYLVASATSDEFTVEINAETLPCPEEMTAEANLVAPLDDEDGLDPAAVELKWHLSNYTTEYRLRFGSDYYCTEILVDWTSDLAESYTVTDLYNNTNYFWMVEERNDGCPQGTQSPVWGFTTHFNTPQDLHATNANTPNLYEGETVNLAWTAAIDRTIRYYNIYMNDELIDSTPMNSGETTYDVEGLTYNMGGYRFNVTAVYDEGESEYSNDCVIRFTGEGEVDGYVYEQDGITGIAGATVTVVGEDEFGDPHAYIFITGADGHYHGIVLAGEYEGYASCEGYQEVEYAENPFTIIYDEVTEEINFIMNEVYAPVSQVWAEYYPDAEDPESPYVEVYWSNSLQAGLIEDFETGDFSQFEWNIPAQYPFEITTNNPYEGAYCMQSTNYNVASSTSSIDVTVEIPRDGLMSFYKRISCESSWDNAYFYIDGAQVATFTGTSGWGIKEVAITAGVHNFKWEYTKDSSVNSGEDRFFIDYIDFIHDAQPVGPGWHTYLEGEFDNAYMSNVGTPSWGYEYPASVISSYAGMTMTKVALFSDNMYGAVGGTFTCNIYKGGATPAAGTLVSSITVDVPAGVGDWVEFDLTTPVSVTNDPLYVLWTADVIGGLGYPAGCASHTSAYGDWWNNGQDGWEHMGDCTWTMKNYFAGRNGRGFWASNADADQAIKPVSNLDSHLRTYAKGEEVSNGASCINPNATFKATANSNDRSFQFYRVYRTNCYNDGPYIIPDNTIQLVSEVVDTAYIDVSWPDAAPGVYKWGVSCVYAGNRESEITWVEPTVGRQIVEIGDGTGTTYCGPFNSLWGYSFVEQIYTAAEIGMAGTINSISFNMSSTDAQTNQVDVFMKNVSRSAFASDGTEYEPVTAGDMVYSGMVTFNGGWTTITLDTPFQYDGTSNLMIGMHEFTSGYSTRYFYCTPTTDYTLVSFHSDSSNPDPYNLGSFGGSKYGKTDRTNIQMDITPGGGSQDGLHESEIVWSNCLDKDMFVNPVDVTVLLNSADSPEGVVVTLTNLNEAEREMYPVDPVTLDESGYYAWDTFRRGDYAVSVTFGDAYEPIYDTVSIWDETHLRYVMTEILYGVGNIYVSRTGWAMWDGNLPGPNPGPTPGGDTEFTDDFENGLGNWTMIDADGDGQNWYHSSQSMTYSCYDYTGWGHNSTDGFAISQSYTDCDYSVYDADNFLVTNQKYTITAGSTLSFWADYGNDSYPDYFSVCVATADNPSASDFTQVWAGTAKAGSNEKASVRRDENRYMNWRNHSIDLSAYAGQNVYIAFRHTDMDNYELYIDDVQLTAGAKNGGERHLEYYKVLCTSIDGVPIYNHNTVVPMCQLDTNDPYQAPLVEGDHYLCKVACMYSTGMSAWSEPVEWVYEPCDHWGPVDFVDADVHAEGNHIAWDFTHGYNPYDPGTGPVPPVPGEGDSFSVDFEGGLPAGWTVIDGNNDGLTWCLTSDVPTTWTYYSSLTLDWYRNGTNAICSGSYVNGFGAANPDEYLVSPQVTLTNGSTFSFWAAATDASYPADHFGVFVSDNGTSDWTMVNEWTLTAKGNYKAGDRASRDGEGLRLGNWYNYTVDLSAYAGQKYIAIRHFNCYDQYIMCVDDIELSAGAKGATAFESGMAGNAYALNITDVANFDERVYVLYNLNNDVRFDVVNGEADGMFMISAAAGYEDMDLEETINDFMFQADNQFRMMDKVQAADVAREYKAALPSSFANSLMMDLYIASRENNLCELADPFCTDNGMYEFPAGVNAGNGETGPDYDCLYTTPNPAWYYMRIGTPGDMDIYMYSTPGEDIDFCCWGPFDDPTTPCPNGLTSDKVVSCSYSAQPTEHCMIPASAQTGEYYILVITNYSNDPCNINFSKVAGSGTTDCGIMPDVEIIGFLITLDGEYLDIVGPTVREYTHEGEFGDHVYCVRPIYPGEQTLPDHNYGWSMGCPVCSDEITPGIVCEAGDPIRGEYVWNNANDFGALISWGEQAEPIAEWLYYDDGTYATSVGAGGTLYWGSMFPASALTPYAGCSLTQVAVCSSYPCTATLNVYYGGNNAPATLVHSQNVTFSGNNDFDEFTLSAALPLDGENLWITFYQSGETYPADACNDTGDANNRWVSIDGNSWQDLAAAGLPGYGWMIRGYVTNMAKGGEVVALNPFKGNVGGEISHSTVVSIPTDQSFMNRAEIVKYNVYRSADNVNYELIGSVNAVAGQTYYEYYDATAAGTYYYQVTAVYDNDCESDPAVSEANPANNYVIVNVTSVAENGEVALYPNPTNGNITIQAQNMNRITVVSVLGQVVYDAEVEGSEYHINMAQFNAGVYMVRIATENGVSTQRVTVVK